MNLNKIVQLFDTDNINQTEVKEMAGRRGFIKQAGNFSVKAALAALPIVLTFMPKAVRAQSSGVVDVLNFALTLEYLESEFYTMSLASSGLIRSEDRAVFEQISKHETAHVNFLKTALGSAAIDKPNFDFTAGGAFPNVFSDYLTFLTVAQAFEDTGVRAYKGQAGNLISDDGTLQAALQIHSVEARHAAEVRRVRCELDGHDMEGWIHGKESNGAPQVVYDGEENITHLGVSLDSITSVAGFSSNSKTAAFDEPLSKEQVLAIVTPFLA